MAPSTIRIYASVISTFVAANPNWLHSPLDRQLVNYVQSYPLGKQKIIAERLGSSFKHFFPEVAHTLPLLHRYGKQLMRQFKGSTKPPMIWEVVSLIIHHLLINGLPTTALAVFLQFNCYLRPSEVCAIRSQHVAFPNRKYLGSQANMTLILLPTTKTGLLQSVTIRSWLIIQQLKRLTKTVADNVKLFPHYRTYRSRIMRALRYYGLENIGYSPYSIRHGAATMDLINKGEEALPGILYRGRWESSAGRLYLQSGAAALLLAALPTNILWLTAKHQLQIANAFEISCLKSGC